MHIILLLYKLIYHINFLLILHYIESDFQQENMVMNEHIYEVYPVQIKTCKFANEFVCIQDIRACQNLQNSLKCLGILDFTVKICIFLLTNAFNSYVSN